jgi:sugar (pentulose or hexulose) kinase
MFQALLHHLGRAVDSKGRELWSGTDCEAETVAEVDALDQRLRHMAERIDALEEKTERTPEANERLLMAIAAPELLAVVRRFLEMYDDVRHVVGPSVREAIHAAEAAIAKAEGR